MGSAADNHARMEQEARRSDSEHGKSDRQLLTEMVQRMRRTETRVTKIANHVGVDGGGEKPHINGNTLYVPSLQVSLADVVAAIKATNEFKLTGETRLFVVQCGDDYLAKILL